MPHEAQSERVPRVTEKRARSRVRVHSLAYVELGDGNAGLILNISESGMAIQAVQMLTSSRLPKMQFRLPKTETLIDVAGKVIWQVRSKKEAGIAFEELPDQSRAAIKAWISAEQARIAIATAAEQSRNERETEKPARKPYFEAEKRSAYNAPVNPAPESSENIQSEEEAAPDAESTEEEEIHSPEAPEPISRRSQAAEGPQTNPPPPPRSMPTHWRVKPVVPEGAGRGSGHRERPVFERNPAMPQWNGRMAPGIGMEFKKSRRWWTYTATLGLLAAVGFAGLMAIDPGLISRARIDALTHESNVATKSEQPVDQNSSTAAQSNSPAQSTAATSPVPDVAAQPASQLPSSTPNDQSPPANGKPTAPTEPENGADQSEAAALAAHSSRNATPSGATGKPGNVGDAQNSRVRSQPTPAYGSSRSTQSARTQAPRYAEQESGASRAADYRKAPDRTVPAQTRSGSTSNQSASSPANTREVGQNNAPSTTVNGRAQQTSSNGAERQSPMDAWRAQTTQPAASSSAPRSDGTRGNQQPAARPQPVQDAYARSIPAEPPRSLNGSSGAARGTASASSLAVVDVPRYESSPVPPSMPLAGVPSGSVAATSQFGAVVIPPNLSWTRSQLPSNLQMGRLVSSYSPAYPIEAAREGIEGVVKLDVTVGVDGTVRSVHVVGGPAMLSSAAVSAVRDWRYSETFLAGQAVESQHYVSMVFRLASAR